MSHFIRSIGCACALTRILFPRGKPGNKLAQEANELQVALDSGNEARIVEEMADCLICLSHAMTAGRFAQLADAIFAKCDKLEQRTWRFDETTETYQHVEEK